MNESNVGVLVWTSLSRLFQQNSSRSIGDCCFRIELVLLEHNLCTSRYDDNNVISCGMIFHTFSCFSQFALSSNSFTYSFSGWC